MPDLLSIGLGGGSHIDPASAKVGPLSVGYRLTQDALVFGGEQLTATDIAVGDARYRQSRRRLSPLSFLPVTALAERPITTRTSVVAGATTPA